MITTSEMPITEDDVKVIKDRKSVEISGEKFKELLEYLTQIEDALSVAEFDLATEHRFGNFLLEAFADSIDTIIRSSSSDPNLKELSFDLFRKLKDCLSQQVEKGSISEDQFSEFEGVFANVFPVGVTTSGSGQSGYAES